MDAFLFRWRATIITTADCFIVSAREFFRTFLSDEAMMRYGRLLYDRILNYEFK